MPDPIPSPTAILDTLRVFLEKDITPQVDARSAYMLKVAGNLLEILKRDVLYGSEAEKREADSLRALLGTSDQSALSVADLNQRLCQRIQEGTQSLDDTLWRHMLSTATTRLSIDNPKYRYISDQ